jgi:hypoxanthine-DNA glycosylase
MPFGLTTDIITAITEVVANCPSVSSLILFGSRAKGNYKPGSDIDIAVNGSKLTLQDFLDFSIKIDSLEIANMVDLIHYQTIKDPDLVEHIARVGIVLYEKGSYRKYGLPPLIDEHSKLLILGSFPSELSLKRQQYYANPANQFWKILCGAFNKSVPEEYIEKVSWLKDHKIALWDVVGSCLRQGSSDSKMKYPIPNDIDQIIDAYPGLTHIAFNGYNPLIYFSKFGLTEGRLVSVPPFPSTSSLNTRLTLADKIDRWSAIRYVPSFP